MQQPQTQGPSGTFWPVERPEQHSTVTYSRSERPGGYYSSVVLQWRTVPRRGRSHSGETSCPWRKRSADLPSRAGHGLRRRYEVPRNRMGQQFIRSAGYTRVHRAINWIIPIILQSFPIQ